MKFLPLAFVLLSLFFSIHLSAADEFSTRRSDPNEEYTVAQSQEGPSEESQSKTTGSPSAASRSDAISPSSSVDSKPAPGQQVERELKLENGKRVEYLFRLPKNYDKQKKDWPLMLFLHGRGESNGPLSLVAKWGPPALVKDGKDLPYILVSPQCPKEDSWRSPQQQDLLIKLLDHVTANTRVDRDRVYLTGLSMGGFGSWKLATDHPDRFAAVAPICGVGEPEKAERLIHLPIWVFHGNQDKVIGVHHSQEMVDAIRAAGGKKVRLTIYEGVGHNSWSKAYGTPELYQWLEAQTISKNRPAAK